MSNQQLILSVISEHASLLEQMKLLADDIAHAARLVTGSLARGGKILICGNGGSAADAQHIAGELVGRFLKERPALPAIALTTDASVLTSLANDYSFAEVFARQTAALGNQGDALIAISTSGRSENVIRAAQTARRNGLSVIGLTGATGGRLAELCDACVRVPSTVTPRIQEMHILVGHILCELSESARDGEEES
jgi:D-sedoheptulose 7-phosphate isomerase